MAMSIRLEEYSNAWQMPDERFEGLRNIANAINDAIDLASGSDEIVADSEMMPDLYPIWMPLRLAARMHEAAERIERATKGGSSR